MNHLGKQLAKRRKDLGLSLTEVAKKIGRSLSYLCDIEKGRKKGTYGVLKKISILYGMNYHYLCYLAGMFPDFKVSEPIDEKEFMELLG